MIERKSEISEKREKEEPFKKENVNILKEVKEKLLGRRAREKSSTEKKKGETFTGSDRESEIEKLLTFKIETLTSEKGQLLKIVIEKLLKREINKLLKRELKKLF